MRIARLIANLPLLQSGLAPVVIPKERRREYIQLLAEYELNCGPLTKASGVWPKPDRLAGFTRFVAESYRTTRELLDAWRRSGQMSPKVRYGHPEFP